MTAYDSEVAFASSFTQTAPVPAAHAEAMERLLDAFRLNHVVFICQSAEIAAGWLNAARLDQCLHQSLMGAAQAQIWPLLDNTWAVALDMDANADQPGQSLRVHSLRRAFAECLEAGWRGDNGLALPPTRPDATAGAFFAGNELQDSDARMDMPPVGMSASGQWFHEEGSLCASPENPPVFTLTPIAPLRAMTDMEDNISELNALLHIIVNKQLHAQFQPIVSLRDGQVFGYEALIRGPKGGTLRRPGALYRAAEKARMVSWFDLACQEQCFARAARQGLRHHLFINMEAEGLAFMDMHERSLATRARDAGLTPASIVVEITERQAVEDFPRLMHALEKLREQGFKIAIDDAGAGYNSLHAIAELRPDFIKIDRALVRNLDVNGAHRALLSALVSYARNIGTRVLAEGSETREELATLIDLGVTYGQGYLMGRPADDFRGVTRETREFIQARHRQRVQTEAGRGITVGALARPAKTMFPSTPLTEAATAFYKNDSLTGIVVVEEGFARGLLMRQSLEHILSLSRSARMDDLIPDETVAQWMQTDMLCAGEEEAAVDVARQATTRSELSLDTDIVVVDSAGLCAGLLPMRVLMEAVTTLQANRSLYADPLTGLPGRVALEQAMAEKLESRCPLALARVDVTGLETYNRAYGLPHGDSVIRSLASLLQSALGEQSVSEEQSLVGVAEATETFLAHLGGDDFVMLMPPDKAAVVCETILREFAARLPLFYAPEQARNGSMEITERSGNTRRIPLLACRVAVVTNRSRRFACLAPMLDEAQHLLRQVKAQSGCAVAVDRISPDERRKVA